MQSIMSASNVSKVSELYSTSLPCADSLNWFWIEPTLYNTNTAVLFTINAQWGSFPCIISLTWSRSWKRRGRSCELWSRRPLPLACSHTAGPESAAPAAPAADMHCGCTARPWLAKTAHKQHLKSSIKRKITLKLLQIQHCAKVSCWYKDIIWCFSNCIIYYLD